VFETEARGLIEASGSPTQGRLVNVAFQDMARCSERIGDIEKAIVLLRVSLDAASPFSTEARQSAEMMADRLLSTCRYADVLGFVGGSEMRSKVALDTKDRLRLTAVLALVALGRHREALRSIRSLSRSNDRMLAGSAALREVVLLQSRGELRRALEVAAKIATACADLAPVVETATWAMSGLLALSGDSKGAFETVAALPPPPADEPMPSQTFFRWSLHAIHGAYDKILEPLSDRLSGRPASDGDALREHLLRAILQELVGDAARATRSLEALERAFRDTDAWRWLLPVTFLLGKTAVEDLRNRVVRFDLFLDLGSSSLFYMLGQVMKARGNRVTASQLFHYAIEADPFNYWAAILARKEIGLLTPSMKSFLA
jgi:tetratricopeptide (TPR) repeat protein